MFGASSWTFTTCSCTFMMRATRARRAPIDLSLSLFRMILV